MVDNIGWSISTKIPPRQKETEKMTRLKFLYANICLGIVVIACTAYASAQQAATTANPSEKPFFQTNDLNTGHKRKMDFTVRALGSVKGRVFDDAEAADTADGAGPQGISGVKVSLRSRDHGFENFLIEQFTDEIL